MTGRYAQLTRKQIDRALADTAELTRRTPREKAEERLSCAKRAFSDAAAAALENRPGAAAMSEIAMKEVERARGALAALDEETDANG